MAAPNAAQAAANQAAADQEFRLLQQMITYNFMKVRGEGRDLTQDEEDGDRYKTLLIPKGGRLRGRFQGLRPRRGRPEIGRVGGDPEAIGHPLNERKARRARRWLSWKLTGYGLHLVRTLGWGGNGIASLFRTRPTTSPRRPRQTFVAKCFIKSGPAHTNLLRRERNWHARYQGALHVVQLKEFQPPPPVPGLPPPGLPADVLFLEYLPRGSLHRLLCFVEAVNDEFPNRVVWLIFQCLIKACIALEYPPSQDNAVLRDTRGTVMGHASERVPPDRQAQYDAAVANNTWMDEGQAPGGAGLVHFDIDPQNILLGGLFRGPPHDQHNLFPVMKLGDFGSAKVVDGASLGDRRWMWKHRRVSKISFYTPEQFTEEWDWVDQCPNQEVPPVKVAGKYSWKTNLYQLALCMICIITEHYPPLPSFPGKIEIIDPKDGVRKKVWSYGAYLLDRNKYKGVDRRLRQLVAQCLCDEPAHRPHLQALLDEVTDYIDNNQWGEHDSDAAVRHWVQRNAYAPPPPAQRHWIDT